MISIIGLIQIPLHLHDFVIQLAILNWFYQDYPRQWSKNAKSLSCNFIRPKEENLNQDFQNEQITKVKSL